jgi:hypothetical protein
MVNKIILEMFQPKLKEKHFLGNSRFNGGKAPMEARVNDLIGKVRMRLTVAFFPSQRWLSGRCARLSGFWQRYETPQ